MSRVTDDRGGARACHGLASLAHGALLTLPIVKIEIERVLDELAIGVAPMRYAGGFGVGLEEASLQGRESYVERALLLHKVASCNDECVAMIGLEQGRDGVRIDARALLLGPSVRLTLGFLGALDLPGTIVSEEIEQELQLIVCQSVSVHYVCCECGEQVGVCTYIHATHHETRGLLHQIQDDLNELGSSISSRMDSWVD